MQVINKNELFERIFFVFIIVFWFYCDNFASFNDDLKYVAALIYGGILILLIKDKSCSKKNILRIKRLIITYLFMVLISYLFQLNYFVFNFLPLKHLFYYTIPLLLAYIIYSRDKKNSDFYFNTIFYITTILFLIKAKDFLSISSISSISFVNSYSPFEEIGLSDFYLILFCYYLKKNYKIKYIISFILCFLCFKRFHIVFMIIIYILSLFKIRNINSIFHKKKVYKFLSILFMISPFLMMYIYSNEFSCFFYNTFGIKLNDFSMGRFNLTNNVLLGLKNHAFINLGLGSTGNFVKVLTKGYLDNMHNDTLRLMIETSYFGVVLFFSNHFKNVYKLPFSTMILIFLSITICISHIMTNFMTWFMFYFFMFMEADEYDKTE